MARNKKEVNDIGYLSAPKTSVKMSIKGADYLVESYFIGKKNNNPKVIFFQVLFKFFRIREMII